MRISSTRSRAQRHRLWLCCLFLATNAVLASAQQSGPGVLPGSKPFTGGSVSSPIEAPASGTCVTPSYTFTGDTNTGIGYLAADNVGVCAGGTTAASFANPSGASFTSNYLNITRTIPNLSAQFSGVTLDLTEPSSGTQTARVLNVAVSPTATSPNGTLVAGAFTTSSRTTGIAYGLSASATATDANTVGTRIGVTGSADDGDINYGVIGMSYDTGTYSYGVLGNSEGIGANAAGGLFQIGVDWHSALGTAPTAKAAIVANSVGTDPIMLGLNDGVEAFRISDTGALTVAETGQFTRVGIGAAADASLAVNVLGAHVAGTGLALFKGTSTTALVSVDTTGAAVGSGLRAKSNGTALVDFVASSTAVEIIGFTNLPMKFWTNSVNRWDITAAGHFIPFASNTYDLCASATTCRSGYFGTSVVSPLSTTSGYLSGARSTTSGLLSVTEALTLSGATSTTANMIPAGAEVVGVSTTTTTTITNASGYQVGDGSDADRYGDITGTAVGTVSGSTNYTADPRWWTNAARAIVLTAKTANFTGGVVQVTVFYRTATGT